MHLIHICMPQGDHTFAPSRDDFDVQPLGHEDLAALVDGTGMHLPVTLRNVIETDTSGAWTADGPCLDVSIAMTFHGKVRFFGLVMGGWQPPLIGNGRVVLLDRNMVDRLRKLSLALTDNTEPDPGSSDWLLRLFARDTFEVSLALHLLEGGSRRQPSLEEMRSEMHALVVQLRERLPNARIQVLEPAQLEALHAIAQERQGLLDRTTAFLLDVAARVAQPQKPAARRAIEAWIFSAAQHAKLPRSSFCVLAALGCLHEDPRLPRGDVHRPGRAVIKPSKNYSTADAYNAAADFTSLEMLVNVAALLDDYGGVFFTGDVGLAAFWCALQAQDPGAVCTGPATAQATLTLTLSQALLPGLSEVDRAELARRLQELA